MLTIKDVGVIDILRTALQDRIVGLEMVADTHESVGDTEGVSATLKEWARARAALRLIEEGSST